MIGYSATHQKQKYKAKCMMRPVVQPGSSDLYHNVKTHLKIHPRHFIYWSMWSKW